MILYFKIAETHACPETTHSPNLVYCTFAGLQLSDVLDTCSLSTMPLV